jgi:hypothetical protein
VAQPGQARRQSARRRWQKSPVTGESTKQAVKTIAQGKPVWTGEPVVPTHVLSTFARGAAGASDTRLSLRPLCFGGATFRHNPGAARRGTEPAYVPAV